MTDKKLFEAGEHVYLKGSYGRLIRKTVGKTYKNGNFVLSGNQQQYSPDGYSTAKVGHPDLVVHRTEELDAEYAVQKRVEHRDLISEALRALKRGKLTDAGLDAIEKIIVGMEDGKELRNA